MTQQETPTEQQPGYLDLADLQAPLDRTALFGRHAPLEVEVGAGRGDFLLAYAPTRPDHDFLGVERKLVYLRRAVNKLRRARLTNVRLLNVEARNLLAHYFEPALVHAVHIYFPDPWPKARHQKRRIVSPETLASIVRVLEPGGYLHLRTDHEEYFGRMMEVVAAESRLRPIEPPAELLAARTGFEARFLAEGKPIYRASFQLKREGEP